MIKNKDTVFYFELIESFNDLKNLISIENFNSDLLNTLKEDIKNIEDKGFVNNLNKMESLNRICYFISEYNEKINALNIINNIDICNVELEKNKLDYEQKHNEIKINQDSPLLSKKIKLLDDKYEKKLSFLGKVKREIEKIKNEIKIEENKTNPNNKTLETLNNALLNKRSILHNEDNKKKVIREELRLLKKIEENNGIEDGFLGKYFNKKFKVKLSEEEQKEIDNLICDFNKNEKVSKYKNENLIHNNKMLKENSLNIINNISKEISKLNLETINLAKENLMKSNKYEDIYIEINEKILNSINTKIQSNKSIDLNKIKIPENTPIEFLDYLNEQIHQNNKKAQYGLMVTNLDEVELKERNGFSKLGNLANYNFKKFLSNFKNLEYSLTFTLTSISTGALALDKMGVLDLKESAISISLAALAVIGINKLVKTNKKDKEDPVATIKRTNLEPKSLITELKNFADAITKSNELYKYKIKSLEDYNNFYEKFENQKSLNPFKKVNNKSIDILPV